MRDSLHFEKHLSKVLAGYHLQAYLYSCMIYHALPKKSRLITSNMNNSQKCLDFIDFFESTLDSRPGMLGPIADISAMFYIVDNIKYLLLFGEVMPRELYWTEFLIEKKLIKNLKLVPIEENWDFERFVELRHQYLEWLKNRRIESQDS